MRAPAALLVLFGCLTCAGRVSGEEARRPNILFCFADDWGRYASVMAKVDGRPSINDVVKTPNIDRVAREGAIFRNAFVPSPSCTPCRSSLLSGRYFFNTGQGAILNGAVWDSAIPSFPLLLRDSGYHIGKSFKVWSPGTPPDAPFGRQQYAFEKSGRQLNQYSEQVTEAVRNGTPLEAAREKLTNQVKENFASFLGAGNGKPWLYWFGPTNTHRKWIKGSGKELWGIDPDALKGKLPAFLPDVPEIRQDIADYLGEVQALDAYIGVLLKELEARGELTNTLVVLSGDHGMPGFPGGKCNLYDFGTAVTLAVRLPGSTQSEPRVIDDFVNLMDLMPTFLDAAGVPPPPGIAGRSLWPVLKSGKSGQLDTARTFVVTGRERHVASAREENRPYPMRALRTKDFLYIRNFEPDRWPMGSPGDVHYSSIPSQEVLENDTRAAFADMDAGPTKAWLIAHREDTEWKPVFDYAFGKRPAEELYDLRKDPDQMKNVAQDPAYASDRQKLNERLLAILTENKDPRVIEAGKIFENPPFTDAGDAAQRNRRSPLNQPQ